MYHIKNIYSGNKEWLIIKKKVTLIIFIVILIIIVAILFFNYRFSTNVVYKERWGLNLPNHKKKKYIIHSSGAGDYMWFKILNYDRSDIEKIINLESFKIVDDELIEKYNSIVNKCFILYLDEEKKELFDSNFNTEDLFVKSNYYAFFELEDEYRYYFEILVLDTKDNKLYSIASDIGPYNS